MAKSADQPWVVMKFGGTSLADADRWRRVAGLVQRERAGGRRVLVVCSALAGVTNALLGLADRADRLEESLLDLRDRHESVARDLGLDPAPWLDEGMDRLRDALDWPEGPPRTAAVLATGEWLSSRLGAAWLKDDQENANWVDAREALAVTPEPDPGARRAWLNARCEAGPDAALARDWGKRGGLLVTQGFVARSPDGRSALLGRSGSDTSAALLGACLDAECVEIWTDVPGLYTADPRVEPNARPITELAWEEALEMAAGGARVIHGRSVRAAAAAGIPLWIRDLDDPEGPGTRITANPRRTAAGARAVVCQPQMLVLLLQNLDTRQQVGFLAGVFARISERGLSVDQVATSETTTTLAIDRAANHMEESDVDELVAALSSLCRVEAFRDGVCVHLVGRDARLALHGLAATRPIFRDHPLLMMSHSAADRSVTLVVQEDAAARLAGVLHAELVLGEESDDG